MLPTIRTENNEMHPPVLQDIDLSTDPILVKITIDRIT